MPNTRVNDIDLYYEESGAGLPLVLLHGGAAAIGDYAGSWAELVPLLAQHYRTLQVELRGHGRTSNPASRLSYAMLADDIANFISALGLAPAHLAGISGGGIVGLMLGLGRPELVRSLVCAGAYYTNDAKTVGMAELLDPDLIELAFPTRSAELARVHDAGRAPGYWRTLIRQVAETVATPPPYSLVDLQRLRAPVLLIAGENDPWFELRQMLAMKEHLPRAELLVVNNAGHDPQHTHPQLVGPAILDFLDRCSLPAPSAAGAR